MKQQQQPHEADIQEINRHIRDGLNQWADICLTAEADQWAYLLRYFPRDVVNATLIFQHVLSSVGIHAGRIDEQKAQDYGQRLRQLVQDMTGYDPADIVAHMKPDSGEEQTTDSTDSTDF